MGLVSDNHAVVQAVDHQVLFLSSCGKSAEVHVKTPSDVKFRVAFTNPTEMTMFSAPFSVFKDDGDVIGKADLNVFILK